MLCGRKICADEASETTETFYFNPSTILNSLGLLAVASVVGDSLASQVATEDLLLHGAERGSEGASGRGARGAVALARGGPPGLMGRTWAGRGAAAQRPRGRGGRLPNPAEFTVA